MKPIVYVVVVVVLLHESLVAVALNDGQLDDLWQRFKTTHNKQYTDDIEDGYRQKVFASNVEYISQHNIEADLGQHNFTLGINQYSDLTPDEYRKFLLGARPELDDDLHNLTDVHYLDYDLSFLPDTVDWRKKGYVTPVKNQGRCGSCWAFSATGALEGQHFKNTRRLVSLSEQNLVDCSRENRGCNGGWPMRAFDYIRRNRGIDTSTSYPYEAKDGPCRFRRQTIGATCSGGKKVAPSESALMTAVATIGPISVAINASDRSFQSYKSGVYNNPQCSQGVNHAVLLVGYGTYNGSPYWLVKNSWGTRWGLAGYIMMSRNNGNQCGIASYASYPTV